MGFQEEYGHHKVIIPFLHVDGVTMKRQMEVLNSALPLLRKRAIIAVAIEHTPDLIISDLISFFDNVKYKTFFLGSRQIARIDHLCPEILHDVLKHPSITPPKPSLLQSILHQLGMIELPVTLWKKLEAYTFQKGNETINAMKDRNVMISTRVSYPPFFIALPGAQHRQAMHIQHMYDLFGGYDAGGGQ